MRGGVRVELDPSISKFRGMAELIKRFGPEAGQGLILEVQQQERRAWRELLAKLNGKGS